MRTDEAGYPCPATLGEYRDLVESITDSTSIPVTYLNAKIEAAPHGADEKVLAPDFQMRALLYPMIAEWAALRLSD
jgi:hypothetical protein